MTVSSEPVPATQLPDGRLFIPDTQLHNDPFVSAFIERFPNYWLRDDMLQGYVSAEKVPAEEIE